MLRKVIFCLSIAFTAALPIACNSDAIEVVVRNDGPDPLKNVRVQTEQNSYTLGDIPPGESRAESFNPDATSDSGLAISHADRLERQEIDIYITGGVTGRVTFEMENGEVADFTSTISP